MKTYVCPSCGATLDPNSISDKGADKCDYCGSEIIADRNAAEMFFQSKTQLGRLLTEQEEKISLQEAFLRNNGKKYRKSKVKKVFWAVALGIMTAATSLFTISIIVTLAPEILIFEIPSIALAAVFLKCFKSNKAFIKKYEKTEISLAEAKAVYQVRKNEYENRWILK